MLIQLAWKNIWRNRIRSLVVLGSVCLGLWVGAFMMAYAFGAIHQRLEDAVSKEVSHFQVHHPNWKSDHEPRFSIPFGSEILDVIKSDDRIRAVSARAVVYGVISSATSSTGAKIQGVDARSEDLVTGLRGKLIRGEYFSSEERNKVILGNRLAERLGVKLRSKIVLTFQDIDGNIASGAFRIAGIYQTYNSTYDELNVFVQYDELGALLEQEGEYHEIAALVHNTDSLPDILDELGSDYKNNLVEDWKQISPELGLMVESMDQYMVIFLVIILLALSFGIINTMLMAVMERTREIGMLMAIGMNKWRIFSMISLETIYLVITASPLGLLLAFVTISYLGANGIDLSAFYEESYAAIGFQTTIYPKLEANYYWQILFLVLITALFSAIFPAISAIRLDPVKAIRTA